MPVGRVREGGFFLIEAMVAILIFALGILGLVALGGTAVSSQSDAQFRTEASNYANAIAAEIALNVNRANEITKATTLATFQHQTSGVACTFSGAATTNAIVLGILNKAGNVTPGGMPGATAANQQILIDTSATGFNRVEITLCWKTASDNAARRHSLVTYVN